MIITKLTGGLGNQMFQYAISRSIQIKNKNSKLILDISSYKKDILRNYHLNIFNLNKDITIDNKYSLIFKTSNKLNINFRNMYKERESMEFNEMLISKRHRKLYLDGYFQSYKYFEDIKYILRDEFSIINKLNSKANDMLENIKDSNSVCIHIRRGDYISDKNANEKHGVCSIEYYKVSIDKMKKEVFNPKFYIFSDDIEWVKSNIEVENAIYIDKNISIYDYEDFELMKNCKHFIIANSTFSWWAAWLSDMNDNIIIAPKQWFIDEKKNEKSVNLIPKSWIRI